MAKRLTATEKVRRDAKIVADRARGLGWALIADRYELTQRQCQSVWAESLDTQPQPGEADPLAVVKEEIARHDAIIEDLALIAESAAHDGVKLGAIKARLAAMAQRIDLMRVIGVLPSDLGLFRHEVEVQRVAQDLLEVCKRHGATEEFYRDIRETLGHASIQRNGLASRS